MEQGQRTYPATLSVDYPDRQLNRLTTFFRLITVIPIAIILALVVFIVLSPLILVAVVILWPSGWGRKAISTLKAAVEVFWSMRGLEVDVHSGRQCVSVSVV